MARGLNDDMACCGMPLNAAQCRSMELVKAGTATLLPNTSKIETERRSQFGAGWLLMVNAESTLTPLSSCSVPDLHG
jgi:hypothetical protein